MLRLNSQFLKIGFIIICFLNSFIVCIKNTEIKYKESQLTPNKILLIFLKGVNLCFSWSFVHLYMLLRLFVRLNYGDDILKVVQAEDRSVNFVL